MSSAASSVRRPSEAISPSFVPSAAYTDEFSNRESSNAATDRTSGRSSNRTLLAANAIVPPSAVRAPRIARIDTKLTVGMIAKPNHKAISMMLCLTQEFGIFCADMSKVRGSWPMVMLVPRDVSVV